MSFNMAGYMRRRRRVRRTRLVALAGGCCIKCGSTDRLQFDHRSS